MRELSLERPLQMLWRREKLNWSLGCVYTKNHTVEKSWKCNAYGRSFIRGQLLFPPIGPHRREALYLEWPWKSFQWIFIPSKSCTHSHWRQTIWVSFMCKSITWRHDLSHHMRSHEWRRSFRCPRTFICTRECRKRHPMSAINEVDPPARSFLP